MKNLNLLKIAMLLSTLFFINPLIAQPNPCVDETFGYVVDFSGLDGCGLLIVLDEGIALEPAILPDGFTLYPGQLLQFSYIERDFISVCMVGPVVEVLCAVEFACDCTGPISGPVCANGITYDSDCTANCLGITDYTLGACGDGDDCNLNQSGWLSVLDPLAPFCDECAFTITEYIYNGIYYALVNVSAGNDCPNIEEVNTVYTCTGEIFCSSMTDDLLCMDFLDTAQFSELLSFGNSCDCICPDIYNPVCGVDGVTYDNACEADCAGVTIASQGECPLDDCPSPWVDSDDDGVCDASDLCPGFDDYEDTNSNGIPDGCEGGNTGIGVLTGNTGSEDCVGPWIDSDNDGICDAADICEGADDFLDTNNNGVPDGCENGGNTGSGVLTGNTGNELCPVPWVDTDADGVCNAADICEGADDYLDTNNNGIPDGCEGGTSSTYCSSVGLNTTYEFINKVEIGMLNNTSGNDGGYGDYTNLSFPVAKGATINVELTPGFPTGIYTEHWKIWIDYNQDGDFDDAGEEAFNGSAYEVATVGTITIPTSASLGSARMRVSMRWNANMSPCTDIPYGEVEDYTVSINGNDLYEIPTTFRIAKPQVAMTLFPNPVGNTLNVELESAGKTGRLEVYNNIGRLIQTKFIGNEDTLIEMATNNFEAGLYMIRLHIENETPIVKRFIKD